MNPPPDNFDPIVDQFEARWKSGNPPAITEYLSKVAEHERPWLAKMLVPIDIEYRIKRGDIVTAGDYQNLGNEFQPIVQDAIVSQIAGQAEDNDAAKALDQENRERKSQWIGCYRLLQKLGEGGMGMVWMAEQEKPVRRRVALKLIKAGQDCKEVVARFEAERQALAMMDHNNIAKVLDGGTTKSGQPFFVMELVQGIPFNKYCDANKLSINERLQLFVPICNAVQHAHQKGIIHRDLKPSNILVSLYDGKPVPKVIDFGLAKALQHQSRLTDASYFTEYGQVVGTLQYMSPEQAEMNQLDVDTRTDIYSLGVILYELLTGGTPIDADTLKNQGTFKVLESIREKEPARPSARLSSYTTEAVSGISLQRQIDPSKLKNILLGELDWIVMKALEKDRTRRYETAYGFALDIQRFLVGEVVSARPPSFAYLTKKAIKRNRFPIAGALAIMSVLFCAAIGIGWYGYQAERARSREAAKNIQLELAKKAAEISREEAKTQSQLAFSTLSSVVTDIQQGLAQFPGTGQIRRKMLKKALNALETVSTELLDQAQVDLSTAKALRHMGEVLRSFGLERTGDDTYSQDRSAIRLAESYFSRALEIATQLAEGEPENIKFHHQQFYSRRSLIYLYRDTARLPESIKHLEQSLSIQTKLVQAQPGEVDVLRQLAILYSDFYTIYSKEGDIQKQVEYSQNCVEIYRKLVESYPKSALLQSELANALHDVAYMMNKTSRLEEAISLTTEGMKINENLAALFPDEVDYQNELARACIAMAILLRKQSRYDEQRIMCQRAVEIRRRSVALDPENTYEQKGLSLALERLGDAYSDMDRYDDSMKAYLEYFAIRKSLFDAEPSDLSRTLDVWYAHQRIAELHIQASQLSQALERLQKALKLSDLLINADKSNYEYKNIHAQSLQSIGNVLSSQGKLEESSRFLEQCAMIRMQRLESAPRDKENVRLYASSSERLADNYEKMKKRAEAVENYEITLRLRAMIAEQDASSDAESQWFKMSITHNQIHRLMIAEKNYEAALTHLQKDLELSHKLVEKDPGEAAYRLGLLESLESMVDLRLIRDEHDLFKSAIVNAKDFAKEMIKEKLSIEKASAVLARMEANEQLEVALGDMAQIMRQPPDRIVSLLELRCMVLYQKGNYVDSVRVANTLVKQEIASGSHLYNAACIFALCSAAGAEPNRLAFPDSIKQNREKLRSLAISTLKLAVERGFNELEHMRKDTDLDSLRDSTEFQALIDEANSTPQSK
jgi:serine/threonine protein kinase